ncbi:MAG: threonine dehydratase [Planctomycetota bacterium]|nr:threonine dehydratase [Planctomycetota bacterium]
MALSPPSFEDVLRARKVLERHLRPTPLHSYPALNAELGLDVRVKHENHQPIGAFKVRGGIYLMSRLSAAERRRGVMTASTGNHGQSIAYAARLFGVKAIVAVPEGANPSKVESMRALGAEVQFHGKDFDDAREHVEETCERQGYRYIHSANEPDLIAGVGTYALEILEEEPDLDVLLVPLGGGSGACGSTIVARAVKPALEVIAAQSEAAPAAHRSWKAGHLVEAEMKTFAEGIATRTAFELTQRMIRDHLDDFVLVSDDEIRQAILLYLRTTRNLAEGAGAVALAAAKKLCARFEGRKIAVVLSGGNISIEQLREVLERAPSEA